MPACRRSRLDVQSRCQAAWGKDGRSDVSQTVRQKLSQRVTTTTTYDVIRFDDVFCDYPDSEFRTDS